MYSTSRALALDLRLEASSMNVLDRLALLALALAMPQ